MINERLTEYLLPNLLRDLHDVIFPADDDLYSRLACRYPMQKEEIFQAHNYLHVNGLLDNSGPLKISDLRSY